MTGGADTASPPGRRVLVTGASRGIGRAIALAFARAGDRLALLSRESEHLTATVEACRAQDGDVTVVQADVTDEHATAVACAEARERLGGVDVLVNNAGIGRYAPFAELSAADWAAMLQVNVLGVANVTRAVLPAMLDQRDGHIVNIGSIRGIETIAGTTAYAASKFAIMGFSQALRHDLAGSGVRVSVIAPGGVKTAFGRIPPEEKDPRFLDPETVAEAVLQIVEPGRRAWIRDLTIVPVE